MSAGGAGGLGGAAGSVSVAQAQAAAASQDAQEIISSQEATEQSLVRGNSDFTNPAASARARKKEDEFKSLESRRASATAKEKKSESTEEKSSSKDLAEDFSDETPELSSTVLKSLRGDISDEDTPEDILRKVQEKISDPKLQARALEYLSISPSSSPIVKENLAKAKAQHAATHAQDLRNRGLNFAAEACSKQLSCSASSLRTLYSAITEKPTNFQEVKSLLLPNYPPQELKLVTHFLVSSMVAEMKLEGSGMDRTKLMCMLSGLYNMQSLIVTESTFFTGLNNLQKQAKSEGVLLPPSLVPRDLTNAFLSLVEDKFPTPGKTEKVVEQIVGSDVSAKTLVLNLFFFSLRTIPPRIFPSAEKRQQLAGILANTLDVININNEDYPQPGDFPKPSPITHDYSAVNFAPIKNLERVLDSLSAERKKMR